MKEVGNSMTFQHLKYLLTVAEKGSITEAAKGLFISQPSLSNAIKEVEKEIGFSIFTRSRTGIALTKEGMEFPRKYCLVTYMLNISQQWR